MFTWLMFLPISVVSFVNAGSLGDDRMMEEEDIICPQCSSSKLNQENILIFVLNILRTVLYFSDDYWI